MIVLGCSMLMVKMNEPSLSSSQTVDALVEGKAPIDDAIPTIVKGPHKGRCLKPPYHKGSQSAALKYDQPYNNDGENIHTSKRRKAKPRLNPLFSRNLAKSPSSPTVDELCDNDQTPTSLTIALQSTGQTAGNDNAIPYSNWCSNKDYCISTNEQNYNKRRRASSPTIDELVDPSSSWTLENEVLSQRNISPNHATARHSTTSYSSSDCDSDDDLPAAFTSAKNSNLLYNRKIMHTFLHVVHEETNFKVGDIVWVKHQKAPFWPCVVKRFGPNRRMTIIFIGDMFSKRVERLSLSCHPRQVRPFGTESSKLKEEGLRSVYKDQFRDAVERAELYLYKKVSDPSLPPPLKYFMPASGYGSDSTDECDSVTSIATPLTSEVDSDRDDAPACSHNTSPIQPTMSDKLKTRLLKIKEQNRKYVDFIKTEATKRHLLGIMSGETASSCHDDFKQGKHQGASQYGFGPLDDEDQTMSVLATLQEYYKLAFPQQFMPNFSYIMAVLLPEALVFALRKVSRVSAESAWKRYHNGPRFNTERRRLRHDELIKSASAVSAEDRQRHIERNEAKVRQYMAVKKYDMDD